MGGPRQQRKPLSQQITELMQQDEQQDEQRVSTLRPCIQCWEFAIHDECREANMRAYRARKKRDDADQR